MSFKAKEIIKQRKSVRSFDVRPLNDEDNSTLEQYIISYERIR